jgi:hypothetical protein
VAPSIDISASTFERVQKHAIPLVDSFDTVLNRLLDIVEAANTAANENRDEAGPRKFDAARPPNLTHTKVVSAKFGGANLQPANWNRLLDAAVTFAAANNADFSKLRRHVSVNVVTGKKEDEGYHYLSSANVSVQGQDANAAWRYAVLVAQLFACDVEVSFIWRSKEGAEYPGQTAIMTFEPR